MKLLRNSLGVVLYPWEARIFTGDDIAGFAYEKTYYQVLVDNRDADELPMELETLRISEDTSRNPSDVKVSFIVKFNASQKDMKFPIAPLTLIGKSWKTHPEIFLKFSFSGRHTGRFTGKLIN